MRAARHSLSAMVRRLAAPLLCGSLLALAMVRVPRVMEVDAGSAHRGLLYENLRLGRSWAEAALTAEGPLAALQTPVYFSGSVWMALAWQVGGNLLLAGVLIALAWRLPWPRRAWALAFLAAGLARWPELGPWLAMVVAGHCLIRGWDREPAAVLPGALLLGFLSLLSVGHVLLAILVVVLLVVTARPPLAKALAAGGTALGLAGGWLLLGQSLPGLGLWLRRGLPLLWQTSPAWRITDLAPAQPWAAVTALGLLAVLLLHHLTAPADRRPAWAAGVFLVGAAWLAWKTIALQPPGSALFFFATVLAAGVLLRQDGARPARAAALMVLGLTGLAEGQPEFLTNALGHFNRQMVFNARQLAGAAALRAELRAQVAALKAVHTWPKLQAIVGREPVGVDRDALPRALFNGWPAALPVDGWNASAPPFVVEGLFASARLAPALAAPATQLALFRDYELAAQENGFLLWRRRSLPATQVRTEVASGELRWGEPLKLPGAPGTAYWLELDLHPGISGRLWAALEELPEPGLVVRDARGAAVRYALPRQVAAEGFLVDPLVRGNADFLQWHDGAAPVRTVEVTVAGPPRGAWLWSNRWRYRLYALPGLDPAAGSLPAPGQLAYRAFNRRPVGTAYTLPFIESAPDPHEALFFVHPDSLLEFAATAGDRRVHGSFGIAPGAYQGDGRTDGVDFAIEFAGTDGGHEVLFRRYLNPAVESRDRGVQEFDVALPAAAEGRLLLRTFNPPGRSAAWDWAFWRNVVIE